jgi:hypothetical protein
VIFESLPGNVVRQVGDAESASGISAALLASTATAAGTITASRSSAIAASRLFSGKVHADGAAVDFLAICPVFCCTCAVWIFKSYEAESFGSARIPIHCYEGVDDSPELAKRVEKRIFGGVE